MRMCPEGMGGSAAKAVPDANRHSTSMSMLKAAPVRRRGVLILIFMGDSPQDCRIRLGRGSCFRHSLGNGFAAAVMLCRQKGVCQDIDGRAPFGACRRPQTSVLTMRRR